MDGETTNTATGGFAVTSVFPTYDIYRNSVTPYRACAGNIYPAKDAKWFHLHSDLNPNVMHRALGLPSDVDGGYEHVRKVHQEKVLEYTASELDYLSAEMLKPSGTVIMSTDEFRATDHYYKANAHVGLWDLHHHDNPVQEPGWWLSSPQTSPLRPLAGLKVVDFSFIIAAPTLTLVLAELGADYLERGSPPTTLSNHGLTHKSSVQFLCLQPIGRIYVG